MVLFTTMAIYLVVYVDVTSMLRAVESGRGTATAITAGSASTPFFAGLHLRLLLALTGGLIVCAILGYVWLSMASRRIGRPVRTISKAIAKLAKGQLNETVDIETSDEFEKIGHSINELAANLQELLLYFWKQTGQCLTLIEHIQNNPDFRHDKRLTLESLGYLKQLSEAVDDLRDMAKAYVFYDVSIEGAKTQAINAPGEDRQPDELPDDIN